MKPKRLLLALLAALLAGKAPADNAGRTGPWSAGERARSGADIFAHICQGCHMPQAQGAAGAGRIPALAGDKALASWESVAVTVLLGRHAMPAFGTPVDPAFVFGEVHLSDAEIASVVNYIRSHFGNRYPDRATADNIAALPHPRH